MKTLFLEAKVNMEIKLTDDQIAKLPKELALFTTIQFINSLQKVKEHLEANNIKVTLCKGRHTQHEGQILGCEYLDYKAPAFLYIGDGIFHPQAIAIKNNKPIFCYNPYSKQLIEFNREDIDKAVKKHKAAILKFLTAESIGILVTTKPGQQFLKRAKELKAKLKNKNVYIFIASTIDFTQMNNFPFIDCWVNSACPRIGIDDKNKVDKPIVNLEDVIGLVE